MAKGDYRSRVYTDRPSYADLEPYDKVQAIQGIIITRLRQHPNAICSYSGGADSDIMIGIKLLRFFDNTCLFPSAVIVLTSFVIFILRQKSKKVNIFFKKILDITLKV